MREEVKSSGVLGRVACALVLTLAWACAPALSERAPTAPRSVPAAAPVVAERDAGRPGLFLYTVRHGDKVSHVLGTIHVGFSFSEVLTPEAKLSYEAAHTVVLEADAGEASQPEMLAASLLPPDKSLRALLGDHHFGRLLERLAPSVPEPMLDRLRPWMPAVMLGMADMQRVLSDVRPDASSRMMDVELMADARTRQKQVLFLETVREQLAVFDAISEVEQVAELKRALDEDNAEQGRAMIEAYAAGDESALTRALFDEAQMRVAPGFYEAVLFKRNERWLPRIEQHVRQGGVFIAVGAAHLFGPRGVLVQLRHRGYKVTRVGSH